MRLAKGTVVLRADLQLDRIEARLRTLTILQQRTRLQIDRMADDVARLTAIVGSRSRPPE